jgi:hypothetical protein
LQPHHHYITTLKAAETGIFDYINTTSLEILLLSHQGEPPLEGDPPTCL